VIEYAHRSVVTYYETGIPRKMRKNVIFNMNVEAIQAICEVVSNVVTLSSKFVAASITGYKDLLLS
jgi:hypothetical protein